MRSIRATAPSNIAVLKYWGKSDPAYQWPANDSISMTLSRAFTDCRAQPWDGPDHRIKLNGEVIERASDPKIFCHVDFMLREFRSSVKLMIDSRNSFPTGCGMASSASGFAALTLAVAAASSSVGVVREMLDDENGWQSLARYARLGSGSATRSMAGGFVHWHRGDDPEAQKVKKLGSQDWELHDLVAIFSDTPKKVGSTEAHRLAWTSPLFAPRLALLEDRAKSILAAIAERDLTALGPIIEQEALEMHAVIMSSTPPVFYFGKEVGEFLAWLRTTRKQLGLSVYFTMDAGPNVHMLGGPKDIEILRKILQDCWPTVSLFHDVMGSGPKVEDCDVDLVNEGWPCI